VSGGVGVGAVTPGGGGRGAGRAGGQGAGRGGQGPASVSPDGKRAALIRDFNLWVRDVATGQETQLTTDGVKDFGYATNNAGWVKSDAPVLVWSPDSKKIATFQQTRGVGDVPAARRRPDSRRERCPATTSHMIERVIIDGPKVTGCDGPIRTVDALRHVVCGGVVGRPVAPTAAAGIRVVSRDHQENLRVTDGRQRPRMSKRSATFESGNGGNWRTCRARTRPSGSRSARTGATSTCTTCRPASRSTRSPAATATSRS
jgi:hypothetical protein